MFDRNQLASDVLRFEEDEEGNRLWIVVCTFINSITEYDFLYYGQESTFEFCDRAVVKGGSVVAVESYRRFDGDASRLKDFYKFVDGLYSSDFAQRQRDTVNDALLELDEALYEVERRKFRKQLDEVRSEREGDGTSKS